MVTMRDPLTAEDHRRIREASTAIEERTGSRIAIVITRVSDRYSLYSLAGATLGAFIAGGLAIAARPVLTGRALIFVELCVLVMLALLLDVLPIRLAMVPARVRQASARNLAHREFVAHLMSEGTHRMRILLFVSLGERYVEILADHATHAIAPEGTWNRVVDEFVASVKSGRIADGIVTAIESCGAMLPSRSEPSKTE
jgi:putative membrane protein